jgi:hypothetical protein
MLRVLSLGAGVQSSTLALMFASGELTPIVDCAIFADTGAEPRAVYDWLDWLETQLPFPVRRVMRGEGLRADLIRSARDGTRIATPPFFAGNQGIVRRQCTTEYKIEPITKKLRELVGLVPRQRAKEILVTQYIGISLDESIRMKPSLHAWIRHEWPLVDLRMRRLDCLNWMTEHGYPTPPRSACTFCPYHSDEEWRLLKMQPLDWAEAVEIDELIRDGVRGTREKLYVHRSLKPLTDVDLASAEDMGQRTLFGEECEGMCGV